MRSGSSVESGLKPASLLRPRSQTLSFGTAAPEDEGVKRRDIKRKRRGLPKAARDVKTTSLPRCVSQGVKRRDIRRKRRDLRKASANINPLFAEELLPKDVECSLTPLDPKNEDDVSAEVSFLTCDWSQEITQIYTSDNIQQVVLTTSDQIHTSDNIQHLNFEKARAALATCAENFKT
ncbi:hypothetical protein AVEN_181569-1 [Araneus ventricosus]|uniref:Uncharacterized protein n=1 Tax=Araneus ventricosus TaxID=182803 RepID=A0A4Y2E2W6_ARAVE|nr:hypothetical protein AVEN_181569-1 [Araneus ventricosus]